MLVILTLVVMLCTSYPLSINLTKRLNNEAVLRNS